MGGRGPGLAPLSLGGAACRQSPGAEAYNRVLKPSIRRAILTDIQFWVPIGVLIFGFFLLEMVR